MKINNDIIQALQNICGNDFIFQESAILQRYSKDKTAFECIPDLVVIPRDVQEISKIMKVCYENEIKITPMARKTGLAGSALAVEGGIILSMERFDKIIEIDENNYQITVEPYVKNYAIQTAVKEKGLFYPPDPASYKISSIGGNVAMSAGGPKAVKYGCTREYVLNLEVVLPSGEIIQTGANVLKNSSGYNLTQLFIGSEGTLGVITKIVLKLIPLPKYDVLMFASFSNMKDACTSVNTIMAMGIVPSGLELMERTAILYAKEYCKSNFPPVTNNTKAHIIIELDGNDELLLEAQMKQIQSLLQKKYAQSLEMTYLANNDKEKANIWTLRRSVYTAIHKKNIVKEMDIVVPRFTIPEAMEALDRVAKEYNYGITSYGHAGDGNLHIGIIALDSTTDDEIKIGVQKSFEVICNDFGGAVSGEHGIGIAQKDCFQTILGTTNIDIMRGIKQVFDPKNILNPGKIFD